MSDSKEPEKDVDGASVHPLVMRISEGIMATNTIDAADPSKWAEKLVERVNSSMLKATSMALKDGVPNDKVAMMVGLAVLSPALGFMVQSTGKPQPTPEQSEKLIAEVWNLVQSLE